MLQARQKKQDFVKYFNQLIAQPGSIHKVENLPDPYDPEKAGSDTEAPTNDDVGNFITDKLKVLIDNARPKKSKSKYTKFKDEEEPYSK